MRERLIRLIEQSFQLTFHSEESLHCVYKYVSWFSNYVYIYNIFYCICIRYKNQLTNFVFEFLMRREKKNEFYVRTITQHTIKRLPVISKNWQVSDICNLVFIYFYFFNRRIVFQPFCGSLLIPIGEILCICTMARSPILYNGDFWV